MVPWCGFGFKYLFSYVFSVAGHLRVGPRAGSAGRALQPAQNAGTSPRLRCAEAAVALPPLRHAAQQQRSRGLLQRASACRSWLALPLCRARCRACGYYYTFLLSLPGERTLPRLDGSPDGGRSTGIAYRVRTRRAPRHGFGMGRLRVTALLCWEFCRCGNWCILKVTCGA